MTTRRPELRALTGLRFVAAMWVLAFHTARPLTADIPFLGPLVSIGYVGVSLFFVLSGFILVYTYWNEDGRLDVPAFLWHRVARVLPVYWLAWLTFIPFALHRFSTAEIATSGFLSFSLLQAWVPKAACAWNCPGWSLSAEACFYLLFPLLLIRSVRNPRAMAMAALVAWGIGLVIAAQTIGLDEHDTRYLAIEYNPLLRVPEFAAGMLIGRWYVRGGRLPAILVGYPVAIAALAACVLMAPLPKPLLFNGLLGPVFLLVVLALAPARGVLASRPLARLGQASYSLYLLHVPLREAVGFIGRRTGVSMESSVAVWCAYTAAAVGVSLAVLMLVEEPARRWLRGHEPSFRRILAQIGRYPATARPEQV